MMVGITVILPTYGKPIYLEAAIKSVQRQTYEDWELIVVDDNDPDTEARELTEKLMIGFVSDIRIHYLKHTKHYNGAVARNTGLKNATGKYIACLDNDDEYMPDRLMKCYNTMEGETKNIAGVYTGCEMRNGGKTVKVITNVKSGNFLVRTLACTFVFCTGSNIFFRKTVMDEIQGFDCEFLRHQDYEMLVRVFRKYNIAAISQVLVIKNDEGYNSPNTEKMIDIKRLYLDKFKGYISELSRDDQRYIYHSNCIEIAEQALKEKKNRIAIEYYRKASSYGRISVKEQFRRLAIQVCLRMKLKPVKIRRCLFLIRQTGSLKAKSMR